MRLRSALSAFIPVSISILLVACSANPDTASSSKDPASQAPGSGPQATAEISGAGSSFVYPLLSKWSADYNTATGNKINYQSIGSGGGIAQIKAGTVDFGSTDKPLDTSELTQANLAQFPSAIGGVVPVINVMGIAAGQLRLTGPVLASIFQGSITKWDDPAITALNPGITIPDLKINTVHRSDGSGTTFNFTNYLSKISPVWKTKIGEGTTVPWPNGVGGKGNEGVASFVQNIQGSIGYVELAYALQNTMAYTTLQNAAGTWVEPKPETFAAAASSADWPHSQDFNLTITNAPGEKAWPITAANFMLVVRKEKEPAKRQATLDFFKWALEHGQPQAQSLDYVPLPAELVQQIETYWTTTLQ